MLTDLNLHPQITKALDKIGFSEATEVQQKVIPQALEGHDVQVSAKTGDGKTLTYLIPLAEKLMQPAGQRSGSRALILLPTRELAQQTLKECNKLADYTKTKSVLITGGQEGQYQASLLRRDPDIIIATPGRLIEHINRKNAELGDIEFLVIDEADRMLDMGFRDEVMDIVNKCSKQRQTMLLSATLNHRGVKSIAQALLREPMIVDLANAQTVHQNIQQKIILSDHPEHKRKQLVKLLNTESFEKALVFANKRVTVSELTHFLAYEKCQAIELHGEIPQDERKHIMHQFKQGRFPIMVATDLAARGLDIEGVDLVINYDMAHSGDEYVHRIGRTGRAGNTGTAISLVADYEWNLAAGIQRYLKQQFEQAIVPGLESKYKGPKKLKKSGKAAGKKKRPAAAKNRKNAHPKVSKNTGRKNIGKPQSKTSPNLSDAQRTGMAPPARKK